MVLIVTMAMDMIIYWSTAEKYDGVESKLNLCVVINLATKFPNREFLGRKVGGGYKWCRTYDPS
jgi:hypothetical protein